MAVIDTGNFIDDGAENIVETFKEHQAEYGLSIGNNNIFAEDVLYVPSTPSLAIDWVEAIHSGHKVINRYRSEHDITNVYNIIFYQEQFSERLLFKELRENIDEISRLFTKYSNLDGYVHDRRTAVTGSRPGVRVGRINGVFYGGIINFQITKRRYTEHN